MDNILGKRIKLLRNESELTQEEFGKKYNLKKSTISQYESSFSRPDDDLKIQICSDFNVTLDWLMGLTDIRNPYENKEGEKFAETNTKDLPQTKTLKDELISLMIRRKIITNDDEINEDMLKMIEKSIETYAELNNSKKVK